MPSKQLRGPGKKEEMKAGLTGKSSSKPAQKVHPKREVEKRTASKAHRKQGKSKGQNDLAG